MKSILFKKIDKNEKNNEVLQKSDKGFGRTIGQSFKSMETKKMEINENLINELLFKKIQKKIAVLNNPKNLDIKNNTIINETVYNFKSLQNLFKMRSPINYENLLQKLNIESKEINKIFDFSKEVRKINDDKKDIDLIEPIFLGNFKELQEIIKSKKNIEKKLRLQINNSHKKLMSEKTYVNIIFLIKFNILKVRTIANQIPNQY